MRICRNYVPSLWFSIDHKKRNASSRLPHRHLYEKALLYDCNDHFLLTMQFLIRLIRAGSAPLFVYHNKYPGRRNPAVLDPLRSMTTAVAFIVFVFILFLFFLFTRATALVIRLRATTRFPVFIGVV